MDLKYNAPGVSDHKEADGDVPEPPRVPQQDLDGLEPVAGTLLTSHCTKHARS